MSIKKVLAIVTATALVVSAVFAYGFITANHHNVVTKNYITYIDNVPTYCDCGTCGAHVTSWWMIHNNDKGFIPVCEFCYEFALQEDAEA